jgi:hypothetical protein
MIYFKLSTYVYILNIWIILPYALGLDKVVPLVVTTWAYKNATDAGKR